MVRVLEQNRKEFDICGIIQYHEAGILGQGKMVVILDHINQHGYCGVDVIKQVLPMAEVIHLPRGFSERKNSVDWIVKNKAKISAVVCSWPGSFDVDFDRMIATGVPVFCAVGNDGDNEVDYPASDPRTIAVGAWWPNADRIAAYSNRGNVDCVVPTDIYVSCQAKPFGGTSASAPLVAGMVVLAGADESGEVARRYISVNCQDKYTVGRDQTSGYGLFVLPKLEVPVMRDLNLLHPELKPKAQKLIDLAKGKGINIIISQTWRTKEEQNDLYAQGRTKSGNIVTHVEYPYSLHCWGVAFDIAVIIGGKANWSATYYDIIGPLGESLGLEWGGRWKSFVDRPHFQLPGYEVTNLIRRYSTPENFMKGQATKEEAKKVAGFEGPAKVVYNGKELSAGILEGRSYVELRALAELLGLKVAWDAATKTVTLS